MTNLHRILNDISDRPGFRAGPDFERLERDINRRRRVRFNTTVATATVLIGFGLSGLFLLEDPVTGTSDTAAGSNSGISRPDQSSILDCPNGATTYGSIDIELAPEDYGFPSQIVAEMSGADENFRVDERSPRTAVGHVFRADGSVRAILSMSWIPDLESWTLESAEWCEGESLSPHA